MEVPNSRLLKIYLLADVVSLEILIAAIWEIVECHAKEPFGCSKYSGVPVLEASSMGG